jgi:hypothetical protein
VDRNKEAQAVAAVGSPVTMPRASDRGRRRTLLTVPVFWAVAAACLLAACGGGSVTPSSAGAGGKGGTATPVVPTAGSGGSGSGRSGSGIPKACTLASAAQVSAALGVSINRTSGDQGSGTGCSWTFEATSLVKGLGTSATLNVNRSAAGMTRSAFYRSIENVQQLKFAPISVDGIPAVQGFGSSQPEVIVDVGPVAIVVAALSTISATDDGPAALAIAGDAVTNLCRTVHCSH